MYHDSGWKVLLGVLTLILFIGIGIAHVINPDWFIKRSGVPKGGTMLTKWNRDSFRLAGAILAGGAGYILYALLQDDLGK
jgi:hypothetical protein